jgi:hypothetical protein
MTDPDPGGLKTYGTAPQIRIHNTGRNEKDVVPNGQFITCFSCIQLSRKSIYSQFLATPT